MKGLLLATATATIVSWPVLGFAATTGATTWETGLGLGCGAFVGRGSDAFRMGGSASLSVGPRPFGLLSTDAQLSYQELSLRTSSAGRHHGDILIIAATPHFYPLDGAYPIEPYLTPIAGYSLLMGSVRRSQADVRFESQAAVLGAGLGARYWLHSGLAIGVDAKILQLFVQDACVQVRGESVTCGAMTEASARLAQLQVALRARF